MIEHWAEECRMPLCYGGGVTTVEQAQRIFSLGVEKIAFSAGAINNPELIKEISEKVGSQSVVVVLDVKKKLFGGYEVYTHNGKKSTGKSPLELIKKFEQLGAGEIIINSIDRDGEMKGYDLKLIESARKETTLPLTAIGGAGKIEDIGELINKFGIIGAAAGSLFVYKGKLKAVLINYPNFSDKENLIKQYF
ncbi:HisA/HisF-related TIM barrel protein [Chryseobacterium wanjuense]